MLDMGNKRSVASDEKAVSGPFETLVIGQGGSPMWSPNGDMIAFISENNLCVVPWKGGLIRIVTQLIPKQFWNYLWSDDSTLVISEVELIDVRKQKQRITWVKEITLNGTTNVLLSDTAQAERGPGYYEIWRPFRLQDGSIVCYKYIGGNRGAATPASDKVPTILKKGTLETESILNKMQLYSRFPHLSPDGTKALSANDRIIDLNHNIICKYDGSSSGEVWSPDSKWIAYERTIDDHFTTVESDIFIESVDCSQKIQVTDTRDELEKKPQWAPDGKKIAYRGTKSGKIFVVLLD